MINWNEVEVGETEIVNAKGRKFIVVCIHDGDVWLYDTQAKYHFDRTIESLKDWTIYDPWEEITDHQWVEVENTGGSRWRLMRGDRPIYVDDVHYKSDGRRVWKRKETQ